MPDTFGVRNFENVIYAIIEEGKKNEFVAVKVRYPFFFLLHQTVEDGLLESLITHIFEKMFFTWYPLKCKRSGVWRKKQVRFLKKKFGNKKFLVISFFYFFSKKIFFPLPFFFFSFFSFFLKFKIFKKLKLN